MTARAHAVALFPSVSLPSHSGGLPVEASLIAQLGVGSGDQLIASVDARQRAHGAFVDALQEPSARIGALDLARGDATSLYTFVVGPQGHPFHCHAGRRVGAGFLADGRRRVVERDGLPDDSLLLGQLEDRHQHQDLFELVIDDVPSNIGARAWMAAVLEGFMVDPPRGVSRLMAVAHLYLRAIDRVHRGYITPAILDRAAAHALAALHAAPEPAGQLAAWPA